MSFLELVLRLVLEIVVGAVVSYAVTWLSEFVQRKISRLWERYWPLFYQRILVPAFRLVWVLVWEIVAAAVVSFAVPWLPEFVERYWPLFYQRILVPAFHLVSDTFANLVPDRPSNQEPVAHAVTNISNGPPSDHEDITGTSVSDRRALPEAGTMEIPLDQNILAPLDSVLHTATNISEGLPLDHEEMTVTSVSEPHTYKGVAVESPLHQNTPVEASDSISNSSSDISPDSEGGTPAVVDAHDMVTDQNNFERVSITDIAEDFKKVVTNQTQILIEAADVQSTCRKLIIQKVRPTLHGFKRFLKIK